MTLEDIATANKMSVEDFFTHCYKWQKQVKYPPSATIREHVRILNTQGTIPPYVCAYINLFNCNQLPN